MTLRKMKPKWKTIKIHSYADEVFMEGDNVICTKNTETT